MNKLTVTYLYHLKRDERECKSILISEILKALESQEKSEPYNPGRLNVANVHVRTYYQQFIQDFHFPITLATLLPSLFSRDWNINFVLHRSSRANYAINSSPRAPSGLLGMVLLRFNNRMVVDMVWLSTSTGFPHKNHLHPR